MAETTTATRVPGGEEAHARDPMARASRCGGQAEPKNDKTLLRRGLIGGTIAAICCFTPLLVVVVAGVGLSAIVGWLDYALFPLLFASMGVVAHALWLQAGKPGRCPKNLIVALVLAFSAALIWLEFRFALRISAAAALAVAGYAIWLRRRARLAPAVVETDPSRSQ